MNKRLTANILLPIVTAVIAVIVITIDPPDSMRQDTPAILQITLPAGNSHSAAVAMMENFERETNGREIVGSLDVEQIDSTRYLITWSIDDSMFYDVNLETGTVELKERYQTHNAEFDTGVDENGNLRFFPIRPLDQVGSPCGAPTYTARFKPEDD